ncbi:MAG: hypothetical protein ABSE79_20770 [Terriglobia bacterium]|jgi:hypothetical protein
MTPLFTVHAGEYLVGSYIEEHFKRLNVWIPSKDTGIDLLITDHENLRTASLQVKFGKDFLPIKGTHLQDPLRVWSWFTIDRDKLRESKADFWVFVLRGFKKHAPDFVVVPTDEYRKSLGEIHGLRKKKIQSYLCVTERNRCWEPRDLKRDDEIRIAAGTFKNPVRDFTPHLNQNGWGAMLKRLNAR